MSGRPHIAIVSHSIRSGGGVGQVARLQAEYLSKDFDVSVVCHYSDQDPKCFKEYLAAPPNFNWLRRFGHVLRERGTARKFLRLLKRINTDQKLDFILYHSHACASLCHRHFGTSLKGGLVVHGDIYARPEETYGPRLRRFYESHSMLAYQSVDMIVTLNPKMKSTLAGYGVDEGKLNVIENGLELTSLPTAGADNKDHNRFVVLFVGRLEVEKDLATLVSALKRCPESVELYVAGRGNLEDQLKAQVQELGLTPRVTFLGYLDKSELLPYYRQSNVLCVPSLSDPLPTVVLEAMSFGLPVIGSNVDGIPHMIEQEKTGLLFKAGDSEELSEALTKLVLDTDLAEQMGRAGLAKVRAEFSIDVTISKLQRIIEQTLSDR